MKDNKLVKAYWTAWRWPEVYSEDKWVIWLSRFIAIVIPISIVALAFITGVPLLGVPAAGTIALLMGLGMLWVTIKLFYHEYPTVENFDAQEARVKEFFHGFPSITDVPLIELDPGIWVAYGHVDEETFVEAIREVVRNVTEDDEIVAIYNDMGKSVGHLYAAFKNPSEDHWDEGLDLCKSNKENSFPITRLEV